MTEGAEPAAVLVGAFKPSRSDVAHEASHVAAARVQGLDTQAVEFDALGWDGHTGFVRLTRASLESLEGTYEDRLAVAVIAYAPRVVILDPAGTEVDMALVDAIRPADYSAELWRLVVERRAAKVVGSGEFRQAYGEVEAAIEEALATT